MGADHTVFVNDSREEHFGDYLDNAGAADAGNSGNAGYFIKAGFI